MTPRVLVAMATGLVWSCLSPPAHAQQYHTYSQVEAELQAAETNHPDICQLHYLGSTYLGRSMWALCITDYVGVEEDEPEFRYISTMHGDEIMGVEMCLYLIDYLTTNYGGDPRVTDIVNSVELWIVPCMNPDGFVAGSRYNAQGVDLNRNFPDPYTSPNNTPDGRAPETQNIMNWSFGRSCTLAANYHGGALVVNYPFDANESGSSVYTPTPDDDMFVWVSEEYSQHNPPMWSSPYFYHGITNGADWYVIYGGMQDWSYVYMGCNEVTIEMSDNKQPPAYQIPQFWNENRESMLAYVETCLIGVRGIVTDATTGQPLAATVQVLGRDHDVFTDPDVGDYHRMLLAGTYDLAFSADGYDTITVTNVAVTSGNATRLDVSLWRTQVAYPNGGEVLTAGSPVTVSWTGNPQAQFHVQYTENAGAVEEIIDDFESGTLDPAYRTGGDKPWYVTSSSSHSGTYSVRAGNITHEEVSWLTRTVDGGEVTFWYRVSSEANYDFFNFYVNGDRKLHVSGNVGWTQYSTTLSPGGYELKWEYAKDYSVSGGSDTVWIDDLQITVDTTTWADIIELTAVGEMSTPWTPGNPGTDYKVRARAYYGGGVYGAWDESDATFEVAAGTDCLGDINGDGVRDFTDFNLLSAAWLTTVGNPNYNPDADLNGDGAIDFTDFTLFSDVYLVPCP